jgi:hypothetical protein
MKRHVRLFLACFALLVAGSLAPVIASAATASHGTHRERAPECVVTAISQPAGTAWLKFCGSGPGRESPLLPGTGPQTVDGFTQLIPPADCPQSAPCVFFAFNSPPSSRTVPASRLRQAGAIPSGTCVQGSIVYAVHTFTVSTDFESNGCNDYLRPCVFDATGTTRCGGWVRTVELVSTTPPAYAYLANGWLEWKATSSGQVWCWNVYPKPSTSWAKC